MLSCCSPCFTTPVVGTSIGIAVATGSATDRGVWTARISNSLARRVAARAIGIVQRIRVAGGGLVAHHHVKRYRQAEFLRHGPERVERRIVETTTATRIHIR